MHHKDQKIAVVGMGRSGIAAAELAKREGAHVLCIDRNPNSTTPKGCRSLYGTDPSEILCEQDLIILSPGVPFDNPLFNRAKEHGVSFIGELGFAASFIDLPILAITGTNGKSSTAWYTKQFLEQVGYTPFIGGNFGSALSLLALSDQSYDVAVVEVSSYQLELPGTFHPKAAVLLNLTPDHLARHKTMDNYAEHKRRIFAQQNGKDFAISPHNQPHLQPHADTNSLSLGAFPGAKYDTEALILSGTPSDGVLSFQDMRLFGHHNRENIAAAALLCSALRIDIQKLRLQNLLPLEHRLELVLEQEGVSWINDSKATNVEATLAGIQGAPPSQILLLGGAGKKGANYAQLLPQMAEKVRHLICFGASRTEIQAQLSTFPSLSSRKTLKEAIQHGKEICQRGDTILLSPACASFDEFQNFEERGAFFKSFLLGGIQ
ncbi:MAG: UDP-N-acetylmuramoyl-L-alanine--D-glutamate ligase [Myxococcota bacterium]|nr:UDP-N-acetylmuramoyl-L-alanine--D-glutamate ligase [Myxococcota bacterium]